MAFTLDKNVAFIQSSDVCQLFFFFFFFFLGFVKYLRFSTLLSMIFDPCRRLSTAATKPYSSSPAPKPPPYSYFPQ